MRAGFCKGGILAQGECEGVAEEVVVYGGFEGGGGRVEGEGFGV